MTEPWWIYIVVFVGATAAVPLIYFAVMQPRLLRQSIGRRIVESRPASMAEDPASLDAWPTQDKGPFAHFLGRFDARLRQAGLRISATRVAAITAAVAAVLVVVLWRVFGSQALALTLAPGIAAAGLFSFLEIARTRRRERFQEQLPDGIDIIVRGVRAGYPLSAAIGLVAREMPSPIGEEFAIAADELLYGRDAKAALERLHRRVGESDLAFLILALSVQERTGGNLLDVLARLSALTRRRLLFRKKVAALTAEGRLSALVLSIMPFIIAGIFLGLAPDYMATVRGHWIAMPATIGSVTALLVGNVIIHRMVRLKV